MVYAVSDLHGMYSLYEKICAKLKPEDKVIFLGDAGDRGPNGWKLIRAILDNPQWIYLKGNHEDMLINAIDETQTFEGRLNLGYDYLLSVRNGGKQTIEDCLKDNEGFEIIERLKMLPLTAHYTSPSGVEYWLTHAGYTPARGEKPYDNVPDRLLLWDRDHLMDTCFDYKKDFYIIHGHTPVEFCPEATFDGDFMGLQEHSPFLYGNNMKIDIDAGAFYTNETYLFNLDEFSFEIIKCEEESDETE